MGQNQTTVAWRGIKARGLNMKKNNAISSDAYAQRLNFVQLFMKMPHLDFYTWGTQMLYQSR